MKEKESLETGKGERDNGSADVIEPKRWEWKRERDKRKTEKKKKKKLRATQATHTADGIKMTRQGLTMATLGYIKRRRQLRAATVEPEKIRTQCLASPPHTKQLVAVGFCSLLHIRSLHTHTHTSFLHVFHCVFDFEILTITADLSGT